MMDRLLRLLTAALAAPSAQSLGAAGRGRSSRGRSAQAASPVNKHALLFPRPRAGHHLGSELEDLAPRVMYADHTPEVQESWRSWQSNASSNLSATLPPEQQAPLRILVITYVANTRSDSEQWAQNVELLQRNMANDSFAFALFHYDGQNSNFTGQPWYRDKTMHCLLAGCKPMLWYFLDAKFVAKFDYVWLMDGDLALEFFSWDLYRNVLRKLRPLVSQPSVIPYAPSARSTDIKVLKGRPHFINGSLEIARQEYRTEVMTPVIDTRIWPAIMKRLDDNDRKADQFVDTFWDLIALFDAQSCGGSAIIVVNGSPVRHMDRRALDSAAAAKSGCVRGAPVRSANNRPFGKEVVDALGTTLCESALSSLRTNSKGRRLNNLRKTMHFPGWQDSWTLERLMRE